MPHPAQINRDILIETARAMIEAEGVENCSLAKLGKALGVSAPSLYHHFSSKTALLQQVNLITNQHLVDHVMAAVNSAGNDPHPRLIALAHAYREFAYQNPVTYQLAFSLNLPDTQPDESLMEKMALPLQAVMAEMVGDADAVAALRGAWALVHGFVMLELHGLFRRDFSIDEAFNRAVAAYLAGWSR